MRFWDSSAVVPLVLGKNATSRWSDSVFAEDPLLLVWAVTPVEVISALWQRVRARSVRETERIEAEIRLAELERAWLVITDLAEIVHRGRRLLSAHRLRAADAMQLAAAQVGFEDDPGDFVTLDKLLGEAARREGFHVITF